MNIDHIDKPSALSWIRGYNRGQFSSDLMAGVTVGVVLIPQSIAYAILAGAPPIHGLYASLIPLLVYAILGTSRQLSVGITAIDGLLVAAGLAALAPASSDAYMVHIFTLAMMVGVIQLVMGFLRFGFVVNLFSRPLIAGFTAAAALIIGFSQLGTLLGISTAQSLNAVSQVMLVVERIGELHPASFAISVSGILILLVGRKVARKFPSALVAVVVTALAVVFMDLESDGVAIVGSIAGGLPSFKLPEFGLESIQALFPTAIMLALVQFMNVISLGKVFAARSGDQVRPNAELLALGSMNLSSSVMGGLPVSGSFSRTAVNVEAGATSPMSSAIAALFVGLALLFFTPIFYFLPIPVFASIIVVSALGLIDISEIRFLWKTKARDGVIASLTFLATLLFGIHQGVLTGVALSVIAVLYRISRPNVAILGHLDGTRTFRGMRDHGDAKQFDGVLILRIDASFSFANADRLREVIMKQASGQDIRAIILDASSINDLDTTALAILSDTHEALSKREIDFYMSGAKMAVVKVLRSSGVHDTIGVDHFFLSVHRALVHVLTGWNRLDEYVGRLP